jgi:hypothetical protein
LAGRTGAILQEIVHGDLERSDITSGIEGEHKSPGGDLDRVHEWDARKRVCLPNDDQPYFRRNLNDFDKRPSLPILRTQGLIGKSDDCATPIRVDSLELVKCALRQRDRDRSTWFAKFSRPSADRLLVGSPINSGLGFKSTRTTHDRNIFL